jgi:hypothetical protein
MRRDVRAEILGRDLSRARIERRHHGRYDTTKLQSHQ